MKCMCFVCEETISRGQVFLGPMLRLYTNSSQAEQTIQSILITRCHDTTSAKLPPLTQLREDELLRTSWVNSDGIIKVLDGSSHLDRHRESLQHLI